MQHPGSELHEKFLAIGGAMLALAAVVTAADAGVTSLNMTHLGARAKRIAAPH